jgi:hypothetical protein
VGAGHLLFIQILSSPYPRIPHSLARQHEFTRQRFSFSPERFHCQCAGGFLTTDENGQRLCAVTTCGLEHFHK